MGEHNINQTTKGPVVACLLKSLDLGHIKLLAMLSVSRQCQSNTRPCSLLTAMWALALIISTQNVCLSSSLWPCHTPFRQLMKILETSTLKIE